MNAKKLLWPLATAVALFTGVAIGSGGGSESVPGPTRVVTKTVAPEACLSALTAGDRTLDLAGGAFNVVSDILNAASNMDVQGMTDGNSQLHALQPKIISARADYDNASSECRRAAK